MSLSTLCLGCGLCCDGTLFLFVQINESEREALLGRGIGVGKKRKKPVMWLPCGKLEGKCCSIYGERPGGCRRFVCALGKRLEGKELPLEEAEGQVREMLARVEAVRVAFEVPAGLPALRYARECIDSTTRQVTDAQLEAFRRVEELRYSVFMPP